MKKNIELSILDFGYRTNFDHTDAIGNIINYAVEAERLNFKRIWFAEHHNTLSIQTYLNPEVIISLVAGSTDEIRVGSGGSLIGYHSAYDTAGDYKFLNNIYSNRIDLGLAKGRPGNYKSNRFFTNTEVDHVSRTEKNIEDIINLYKQEEKFLNENKILLPPYGGTPPQLWYLSNSYNNLSYCLKNELNFCRSLIHGKNKLNSSFFKEELDNYKKEYFSTYKKQPVISIAIAISFSFSEEDIKEYEKQNKDNFDILTIIPVDEKSFIELTEHISKCYGINDIIVFDVENDDHIRVENLAKMAKAIM